MSYKPQVIGSSPVVRRNTAMLWLLSAFLSFQSKHRSQVAGYIRQSIVCDFLVNVSVGLCGKPDDYQMTRRSGREVQKQ